jgi:hypothetical protein
MVCDTAYGAISRFSVILLDNLNKFHEHNTAQYAVLASREFRGNTNNTTPKHLLQNAERLFVYGIAPKPDLLVIYINFLIFSHYQCADA